MMDYEEKYTYKKIENPITKELGNYIQYNGSTIFKLDSIEDCKTVCHELNRLDDLIEHYKSEAVNAHNVTSDESKQVVINALKDVPTVEMDNVSLTQLIKTVLDLKALAIYSNRSNLSRNKLYTELTYLENQLMKLKNINIELKRDWWEE